MRWAEARVALSVALGIVLQAAALWALATARGAETPYMAMKMIYLAVYPASVFAAAGVGVMVSRLSWPAPWGAATLVIVAGLRAAAASPPPPPVVSIDLDTRKIERSESKAL